MDRDDRTRNGIARTKAADGEPIAALTTGTTTRSHAPAIAARARLDPSAPRVRSDGRTPLGPSRIADATPSAT